MGSDSSLGARSRSGPRCADWRPPTWAESPSVGAGPAGWRPGRPVVRVGLRGRPALALRPWPGSRPSRSRRFGAGRTVAWHRVGRVRVGEAAVVVGAACGHRAEAFAAARFLIDELNGRCRCGRRSEHDPCVDRDHALPGRADDQRVDVELGDLGEVDRQLGETLDRLLERRRDRSGPRRVPPARAGTPSPTRSMCRAERGRTGARRNVTSRSTST